MNWISWVNNSIKFLEAPSLDQRMGGLYEDMGHILSRYYKFGEITEDEMKSRLGINESKEDCGCGCGHY